MSVVQASAEAAQSFEPDVIALKMFLAVGIGLLVGFEREWSHKDIGVRSFALAAMLGMLGAVVSMQLAFAALLTALVIIIFVNWGSFQADHRMEITTSIALMITVVLGVLVGLGHHFTPVAAAILMTMLLAWKEELHRFAGGLKPQEIRSAVLLGLIGFVIYPALPNRFIDYWQLLNPRQAWVTIIVVALVGFVNYVLLRLYSTNGLLYTAALGGLVNSTATVSELATSIGNQPGYAGMTVGLILIATIAMFARNLLLLAIFAPSALASAGFPILAMTGASLLLIVYYRPRSTAAAKEEIILGSPVSLRKVFTFGILFVAIAAAGALAKRFLGHYGVLLISAVGGLVSSAGTTAAAANLAHNAQVSAETAGLAVVVTSVTSALVNVPLVSKLVVDKSVRNHLMLATLAVIAVGLTSVYLNTLRF